VQPKSSEPSVLGDALGIMVDDGERIEQERHTLAAQRCRCAVRRLGHVEVQMRPVGVPRIADRAEHLALANRIAGFHLETPRLEMAVEREAMRAARGTSAKVEHHVITEHCADTHRYQSVLRRPR